ncbi:MAG: uroporphyrinogen-III synthase [Methylophilaceae bacterium]
MANIALTDALKNKTIVVTRPSNQTKKLKSLVEQAGGITVLFPLIEIVALDDYSAFENTLEQIKNYDWAIFISSNAVQYGVPKLIKQGLPKHLKFAAIGPVTAQALNTFAISNVLTPKDRFDSEALLALAEMRSMQNKKVMLFRGVGGREVLADTLRQRGAMVTFAECYQRINPQRNCNALQQFWIEKKLHGIVITSSEAMRHFIELAGKDDWLKHIPIFVNHARIAELPLSLGLQVHVTETGGEASMLQRLVSILSVPN